MRDTAALGGAARVNGGARSYRFGDLTSGLLAAGRLARGGDLRGTYKFGDWTRGVVATARGAAGDRKGGAGVVAAAREAAAADRDVGRESERVLREHLAAFLARRPAGSYEVWISELHPENARGPELDARLYAEGSLHRRLWNDTAPAPAARAAAAAATVEARRL